MYLKWFLMWKLPQTWFFPASSSQWLSMFFFLQRIAESVFFSFLFSCFPGWAAVVRRTRRDNRHRRSCLCHRFPPRPLHRLQEKNQIQERVRCGTWGRGCDGHLGCLRRHRAAQEWREGRGNRVQSCAFSRLTRVHGRLRRGGRQHGRSTSGHGASHCPLCPPGSARKPEHEERRGRQDHFQWKQSGVPKCESASPTGSFYFHTSCVIIQFIYWIDFYILKWEKIIVKSGRSCKNLTFYQYFWQGC